MNSPREEAVRHALRLYPGSLRSLAMAAGVSEVLLRHIRDGIRAATPHTVEALAEVLDRWSSDTAKAARILRESLSDRGRET